MQKLRAFLKDESGATAVEYGLLATILGIGLIVIFTLFGDNLRALFGTSETGVGDRFAEAQGKL
jgi:pilus assembly protein Flp/PilA